MDRDMGTTLEFGVYIRQYQADDGTRDQNTFSPTILPVGRFADMDAAISQMQAMSAADVLDKVAGSIDGADIVQWDSLAVEVAPVKLEQGESVQVYAPEALQLFPYQSDSAKETYYREDADLCDGRTSFHDEWDVEEDEQGHETWSLRKPEPLGAVVADAQTMARGDDAAPEMGREER